LIKVPVTWGVTTGFPNTCINWLAELLRTASTRVMLNGEPGRQIFHMRGLLQGDPLSPMLFILVIEVLGAMFRKADEWNLLRPLGVRQITQ
jgi:hypothetical protein